jgi:UDP-glucose:(heptosyl)LPS alpha-1,3-glucosyltransferase
MRVALVVERFAPTGGGVERVAWQVAHRLAEAGDEVNVVARLLGGRAEGSDPPLEHSAHSPGPSNLQLHRVSVPYRWQPMRVAAFSRGAEAQLRAIGALDVIHGFARTRRQDIYRAGAGSHHHAMQRIHGKAGAALRRLSPRHRVQLAIESSIFSDPTRLIHCVSQMVRDEIKQRYDVADDRLAVIPNGVDSADFDRDRCADAAAVLRRQLSADGRVVWLFAGSGARRKGLDTALAALAACRDERAVLWIAGRDTPGPWQRLADRLGVGPRVRFIGPRDDMPAVFAAADALIHPTRYDPFANVCLEAAASHLPIVTSGANGSAEVLADAAVTVADPECVSGFAAAMDDLADAATRKLLGERGRSAARALDWTTHVDRLRRLYQHSIDRRTVARGVPGLGTGTGTGTGVDTNE